MLTTASIRNDETVMTRFRYHFSNANAMLCVACSEGAFFCGAYRDNR